MTSIINDSYCMLLSFSAIFLKTISLDTGEGSHGSIQRTVQVADTGWLSRWRLLGYKMEFLAVDHSVFFWLVIAMLPANEAHNLQISRKRRTHCSRYEYAFFFQPFPTPIIFQQQSKVVTPGCPIPHSFHVCMKYIQVDAKQQ